MAAKEMKKAVNLACPMCYQVFRNSKHLPCHHSYCEECMEKMQQQQSIISCPECRKETDVPTGEVKEPSNNLDKFVLKRNVKCNKCDEDDPVVSYCPDCSLFLCQVCNEAHKRGKSSRSHGIVSLTDLRSNKDVLLQSKVPMCKEHDYELKHYCETCEELVCLYCTMKEHRDHNHDIVKKMADKHRSELCKATAPVEEMIESLSNAQDNIDKMKKKIRQRYNEVDKKIEQQYDVLIHKLLEQKEQLKQQAYEAVSQKEKALTMQLQEVECVQTEVLSMKELKDAIEKSSDQEALSAKKLIIARMHQITNRHSKLNVRPLQSATMEFILTDETFPQFGIVLTHVDPNISDVKNLPYCIPVGEILEFSIITKYRNGSQCSIGGSEVSVQLECNTKEVTRAQVWDNNDGSYTASLLAQPAGKVRLLVFIDGQQIKGSPYSFVVQQCIDYTRVSEPSKIVNNDGNMGRPWGIAFSKNGMWAIVDYSKHCVYIFDEEDQLIHTFGSQEQFISPIGIAFDDNNHLYVTDRGFKSIKKFDLKGNYLFQLDSESAGLRDPVGITTYNHRIYVVDYKCNCVFVFQTDGQFCQTIGKGHMQGSYDVAVSVKGVLFVAGWDEGCIYSFTLDDNYIGKFGKKGMHVGLLQCPSSIAVDLNGFILVAEYTNNRISIFDDTGKFVHCLGSIGYEEGKFQRPYGIALSLDGSIYVSDMLNKRIQVFTA